MKIPPKVKKIGEFIDRHFESLSEATSKLVGSITKNDSNDINTTESDSEDLESNASNNGSAQETPENEDFFNDSADKLMAGFKESLSSNDPKAMFSALNQVTNETIQFCAEQETKQVEINARKDVAVSKIKATTEIISKYLDKTFDERSSEFDHYFKALDNAIETNDVDMLRTILLSINNLANQSPFKNVSLSEIGEALKSPETEWDI